MRLWLNRIGDISLREQLITQIIVGILCHELTPGQRLPSTRDLSRRFGIHANTASAAYRQLESEGWVELRHGSGVFVRTSRPNAPLSPEMAVDQMLGDIATKARKLGVSDAFLKARMRRWLALEPPARWLVIEPDPELLRIVICEMEQAVTLPVVGCGFEECSTSVMLEGSMPATLPSKVLAVRKLLPTGTELVTLQVHPVAPELQAYLQRYMPEHSTDLLGIASRWGDFQRIAQTMLIAAGFAPESLLVRDATKPGWKRGLDTTTAVLCDAAIQHDLPAGTRAIVFRLFDEASIKDLRSHEENLTTPDRN
ncbi:GntR family transcriptional regulator [Telmatobacter sp. DSM 110680]|uniref:GntR family transcriptional regulator n=1 Tax=Telmatobacter sp. DSM 110680 TaxID=3036704 RepID=A0AAU7DK85_9BACT